MKVSLVVASGAHQGKVIPIVGTQFLIGRDAQCQLRPASQAISKNHCGVIVRDGQIYIKDFGSTNGTLVNDELIKSAEVSAADGTSLKIGPLDFIIRVELESPKPDGTPLTGSTPENTAALAAVKAAAGSVASKAAPSRDATPNPAQAKKPAKPTTPVSKDTPLPSGSKETAALTGSKEAEALKSPAPTSESFSSNANLTNSEDDDKMAAFLLNMGDESVPDGSTVIELPAVDAQGRPLPPAEEKPVKKVAQTREEMSSAASDLLRKMMRRPK